MQLTKQHIEIVEQVVTTENGLFLARFAVVSVGGVLKAKLVSMTAIEAPETIESQTILLADPKEVVAVVFPEPLSRNIVSPYAELFFLSSISPRAPNFK